VGDWVLVGLFVFFWVLDCGLGFVPCGFFWVLVCGLAGLFLCIFFVYLGAPYVF
jgi:hypothetical protein